MSRISGEKERRCRFSRYNHTFFCLKVHLSIRDRRESGKGSEKYCALWTVPHKKRELECHPAQKCTELWLEVEVESRIYRFMLTFENDSDKYSKKKLCVHFIYLKNIKFICRVYRHLIRICMYVWVVHCTLVRYVRIKDNR